MCGDLCRRLQANAVSDMVLTFYLGVAAVEFKQYAAYVQRRTASSGATDTACPTLGLKAEREGAANLEGESSPAAGCQPDHRALLLETTPEEPVAVSNTPH
jgi:hypothetical protein